MEEEKDARAKAFCNGAPAVFEPVLLGASVWRSDPFDIDKIHERARITYRRLLSTMEADGGQQSKILLVLGAAGSGKTHLIRAFRNQTHADRTGYVCYVQLSSDAPSYPRYVLRNVVDSLEKQYAEIVPGTCLERLSAHLAEDPATPPEILARLRDEEAALEEKFEAAREIAETLRDTGRLPDFGVFRPIEALLLLQAGEARVTRRVYQYLRGDRMDETDRRYLANLLPIDDQDPVWVLDKLAKLVWALDGHPLVICFDQLEEVLLGEGAIPQAVMAVGTVCELANKASPVLIVVTCLEDQYYMIRDQLLTQSYRDRLEQDPAPERLDDHRTAAEVRFMIAGRLAYLFESTRAGWRDDQPLYPFPETLPEELAGQSSRRVLEHCRLHRERCIHAGRLLSWTERDGSEPIHVREHAPKEEAKAIEPIEPADAGWLAIEQSWNDFRTAYGGPVPEDDAAIVDALLWAVSSVSTELRDEVRFDADVLELARSTAVRVRVWLGTAELGRSLVAICNRPTRGGGLTHQIGELVDMAKEARDVPVALRSGTFPTTKALRAELPRRMAQLLRVGGRRVAVAPAEMQTLVALRAFLSSRADPAPAAVAAWRSARRPAADLTFVREMLDLDVVLRRLAVSQPELRESPGTSDTAPKPGVVESADTGDGVTGDVADRGAPTSSLEIPPRLPLGWLRGVTERPLDLDVSTLKRHAMVLAGSGSGKTVLVCNLLEQLALRDVAVLMVDRKGDLATYADPAAWSRERQLEDEALRRALHLRTDVRLLTPGCADGWPVRLPILPDGLSGLRADQREDQAQYAAAMLLDLTDARSGTKHHMFLAILKQAILALADACGDDALSLERLIELLIDQDPVLLARLARLDPSHCAKLAQSLEIARLNNAALLTGEGEDVDLARLLCTRGSRVPFTIVCTRFLSEPAALFWVAQLLTAVGRHASRHPSGELSAVLFFDEADCYLPANQKPPTKEPMENLLKRARSAGLGVILATQSPGDLDYRCRDQVSTRLIGRISEMRAIEQLTPVLQEGNVDASLLATQDAGEFILSGEGRTDRLRSRMSLIRPEQVAEERIAELARRARSGRAE